MEKNVGSEMHRILNDTALSPEDFALRIGVGKSSVYNIINGKTKKFSREFSKRVSDKFEEYSYDYMMSLNKETVNNRKKNTEPSGKSIAEEVLRLLGPKLDKIDAKISINAIELEKIIETIRKE